LEVFLPVVALQEKGYSPLEVSNYRGITLISCNLKNIFETILSNRLLKFLEGKRFFSDFQAAFRKHRSSVGKSFSS